MENRLLGVVVDPPVVSLLTKVISVKGLLGVVVYMLVLVERVNEGYFLVVSLRVTLRSGVMGMGYVVKYVWGVV